VIFRRIAFVLSIGLLGVVSAGCSSGGAPAAKSPSSNSTTTTSATSSGQTTIPYDASKNARADVTVSGPCLHEPNTDWVLHGTVANRTAKTTGFTIVVDFVTQPGNTVLDTQVVKVDSVAPHQSSTWGAAWPNSAASVACVIRQAQSS